MQELEKILEEIDQNQVMLKPFDEEDRPTGIINVDVVKDIIRKHMNDGKLDEDISVILEEVETAFDKEKTIDQLKEEGCIIDDEAGNRAVEIIEKGGLN